MTEGERSLHEQEKLDEANLSDDVDDEIPWLAPITNWTVKGKSSATTRVGIKK